MSKIKNLYAIEVKYFERATYESVKELCAYRMRGLTWEQLRIFRETVFTAGLFVPGIEGAQFGDGFIVPPSDICKIYVYLTKEKYFEPTIEELR